MLYDVLFICIVFDVEGKNVVSEFVLFYLTLDFSLLLWKHKRLTARIHEIQQQRNNGWTSNKHDWENGRAEPESQSSISHWFHSRTMQLLLR